MVGVNASKNLALTSRQRSDCRLILSNMLVLGALERGAQRLIRTTLDSDRPIKCVGFSRSITKTNLSIEILSLSDI